LIARLSLLFSALGLRTGLFFIKLVTNHNNVDCVPLARAHVGVDRQWLRRIDRETS